MYTKNISGEVSAGSVSRFIWFVITLWRVTWTRSNFELCAFCVLASRTEMAGANERQKANCSFTYQWNAVDCAWQSTDIDIGPNLFSAMLFGVLADNGLLCVCAPVCVYLNGSRAKHKNTTMKTNRNVCSLWRATVFLAIIVVFMGYWCARKYARTRSGAWCLFSFLRQKQSSSCTYKRQTSSQSPRVCRLMHHHSIHVCRVPIAVDPLLIRPSYKSRLYHCSSSLNCIVQPACRRTYRA